VVVTIVGLAISFFFLISSSKPEVSFFDGALQVLSLYFQLLGLLIGPYTSEFTAAFSDFNAALKSVFNMQPSSSENSGGGCLYPSMTTKDVMAVKFAIYGIFYLDFLFLACIWPKIKAPILARLLSLAAMTTATAIRAAKAVESRMSKRFKRESVRESERTSENNAEMGEVVQMEVLPHTLSTQENDSKPTSILVFADSIQSRGNRGASGLESSSISNTDTRGAAALQLFLLTYISPVEICLQMLTCYNLDNLMIDGKLAPKLRWWYDGTEQCLSSWQYAPLFSLIALAFLPLVMALRATWLKRRFSAGGAAGPTSKGWFWEASYFEFYSSSFRDACPHWLPVQLFLRVLVLMMTIIPFPYWRLFCINMILFIYLIVELIVRPWRMKSVQVFSFASFFLLVFATGILFRPATLQANLFIKDLDGFRSTHFAVFMFFVILVVLPICFFVFLLAKKNYFDN